MALTVRTNGSSGSNLIQASWWNDYYNLLTGAMQDQEVTIQNNVVLKAIGTAPSAAATAVLATGTNMGIGLYVYVYSYQSADGESLPSPTTSITTTSGNQKVNLSGITVGPTGTTGRYIYRTVVGGGTNYKLVATIADNVTTTYTDTTADASLGTQVTRTSPTFGGALIIKDSTGTVKFTIANDGSLIGSTGGTSFGNTTITGTLAVTGAVTLSSTLSVGTVTFNNGATMVGGDLALNTHGITSAGLIVVTTVQTNAINDSGGSGWASITAGTTTRIQSAGTVALQAPGGSTVLAVTSGNVNITGTLSVSSSISLPTIGTLKALTSAAGTGNGTSNTLITNPTAIVFDPCTVSGSSQTIGGTTTTTTTITTASGLAWRYIAYLQ